MSRRVARRQAVELLYAADVRGESVAKVLAARPQGEDPLHGYAVEVALATDARRQDIDGILRTCAPHWPVDRMSAVDRNVLRLAIFEMQSGQTPPAVAIDEAVELAKRFSGDEAGKFVNGVLGAVLRSDAVEGG